MSSDVAYSNQADGDQRVIAVGLLTERDLAVLGEGFKRAFRIDQGHEFHDLLAAIDAAERASRA